LRHGTEGGTFNVLKTNQKNVYAYTREKGDASVLVILNLGKKPLSVELKDGSTRGTYKDLFSGEDTEIEQGKAIKLDAWGYLVFTK
jgi:hypothetical protein